MSLRKFIIAPYSIGLEHPDQEACEATYCLYITVDGSTTLDC